MKKISPLAQVYPQAQHRYRKLPLFGSIADDYADWCLSRGFAVVTTQTHLDAFRRLLPRFHRMHLQSLDELTADDISGLRRFYRRRNPRFTGPIRELGCFLTARGRLRPGRPVLL